jgi:hypothetical protein
MHVITIRARHQVRESSCEHQVLKLAHSWYTTMLETATSRGVQQWRWFHILISNQSGEQGRLQSALVESAALAGQVVVPQPGESLWESGVRPVCLTSILAITSTDMHPRMW